MGELLIHMVPAIGIGFIIQVVFHELGHLIGGLLTGWKFLYMKMYRIVIFIENKGLKLKIVGDTGYKCIMYPKSINQEAVLYTICGILVNLFLSIAGLIILVTFSLPMVIWLYVWSFTVFGIGMLLMNGIKSTIRVCNDKACYNLLKANKYNRHCHNAQLIIAKLLMDGLSYSQIGEKIICLCPSIVHNDIQAYQAVLEYYYYLDTNNHMKLEHALDKIREKDNISNEVLNIIELEHIYLQLITAINLFDISHTSASINNINEEINKHRKEGDIHSLRVKAVYKAYKQLSDGKANKALGVLSAAIRSMKEMKCIYEGERIFCINQLESIEKTIRLR